MFTIFLFLGLFIIGIALWRGWLTRSGATAALLVGGLTLGLGGVAFVVPLLTFFITSSLLSKIETETKRSATQRFVKSHQRDAVQVFANGGLGALAAVGYGYTQEPVWFAFFIGVMATVTADTWATELGTLSKSAPRSVTTGKIVAPGMSGGVSMLGLAASVGGGLLIGCVGALSAGELLIPLCLLSSAAGLAGSLLDSLLGATLQRHYWDPVSRELTERHELHGRQLDLRKGVRWMNNDVVNLLAAVGGGVVGVNLWLVYL